MTTEPWVSVEAVAKLRGVVRVSADRWIDGRGLPAPKIGHLRKFKLTEGDERVRAGGANAHPSNTGPNPRGTR